MYINLGKFNSKNLDFKPGYGGDTVSSNWKNIYQNIPEDEIKFASLRKKFINDSNHGNYARQSNEVDILDDAWLHMVNASDWAGIGKMDLKLQKVKELLNEGV